MSSTEVKIQKWLDEKNLTLNVDVDINDVAAKCRNYWNEVTDEKKDEIKSLLYEMINGVNKYNIDGLLECGRSTTPSSCMYTYICVLMFNHFLLLIS